MIYLTYYIPIDITSSFWYITVYDVLVQRTAMTALYSASANISSVGTKLQFNE
jgi:hypothetical protein